MTKKKTSDRKERDEQTVQAHASLLSDFDINLFREGRHYMLYKHLGAHHFHAGGEAGMLFSVWAPAAGYVSVTGEFNGWDKGSHPMQPRWDGSGIWELFVTGIAPGSLYKYHISHPSGFAADKADPFAFATELPPHTASRVAEIEDFRWTDKAWMKRRSAKPAREKPMSIYEVHTGSWRSVPEDGHRRLSYRELAEWLPAYCVDMGFTHAELLPVMEHPYYASWGYQITGYFAPSARYGTPADFRHLINELHRHGVGVILDWVPSHFPGDTHGLYRFDGSHLYEHADPREGYHPDWQSYIFNYGRNEVRSFLISNAIFWLEEYHIDGLRVDAVASMLYRDYSRKEGEWIPNRLGGRENLEAIAFLRELNEAVHTLVPGAVTIAEESTAFPGVTHPVAENGLGFDFKWMMGWMHDTLEYFKRDPLYRSFHQHQLSFSMHYAYSEKYILPLSHDEVVHGKYALMEKMPGDSWQKAANLRLLYSYMYGHPGGKLLFMGGEFGQLHEWQHDYSLDWHLLEQERHRGIQHLVKDLNVLYKTYPAFFELSYAPEGFEWIDFNDSANSVFCWIRKGKKTKSYLVFIMNATPSVLHNYSIGVPRPDTLSVLFNSDSEHYGGSGVTNRESLVPQAAPLHGRGYSLSLSLPPLGLIILKPEESTPLRAQAKPLK